LPQGDGSAPSLDGILYPIDPVLDRYSLGVFATSSPDRYRTRFLFFVTGNEYKGNLLHLDVADSGTQGFVFSIHVDAEIRRSRYRGNPLCVVRVAFRDWQEPGLDRSQPDGKSATIMLDQDAEKTFERAKEGSVNNVGTMVFSIGSDVAQAKALRQIEVELNGRDLPCPAQCIFDLNVELGAIECTAAFVDLVIEVESTQCPAQRIDGSLPLIAVPHGFLGLGAQEDPEVLKLKCAEKVFDELQHSNHFILELFRTTENVSVILGKASHPK